MTLSYCSAYVPSVVNLHSRFFPESKLLITVTDLMPGLCEGPTLKVDCKVVAVFPSALTVSVKQLNFNAAPSRPFAGTEVVARQTLLAAEPGLPVVAVAGLPNTIPRLPAPGY